jgi:hypothetical protein
MFPLGSRILQSYRGGFRPGEKWTVRETNCETVTLERNEKVRQSKPSAKGKWDVLVSKMVNEQGGVTGRKINFISLDDGYSPPKTLEQVRRLIEEDKVAFLFNTLGTATHLAIQRYVNERAAMRASMTLRATSFSKTVSTALKVMPIAPRPNSTGVPSVWIATW